MDTGVLPPHTPNTVGNILPSVSVDIDVHVQPQNATENKNILTPTDVDTDVHPQAPKNAGNILSPVDVNTGPGSRLTLKSMFLQESIYNYKDIVDNLSAKVAEKWVKECCNITPASTGAINKKLIIKETEKALNGKKAHNKFTRKTYPKNE